MSGKEVRALRNDLGMSQQTFSKLIGVSYMTVQSWEIGRWKVPALVSRGILAVVDDYRAGRIDEDARKIA